MTSNISLCLTHMLNNSFTVPAIVRFVWIDTNLANFDLSTTTKMASVPSHSKKYVIKSIEILSKGLDKIGKALYDPIFFCVPTWYFGISHKCEHNALHLLSFWANNSLTQSRSHGFLSMMSYHWRMMMQFLHGFCVQLPLWHIDSQLLPSKQPIQKCDPFHLFLAQVQKWISQGMCCLGKRLDLTQRKLNILWSGKTQFQPKVWSHS